MFYVCENQNAIKLICENEFDEQDGVFYDSVNEFETEKDATSFLCKRKEEKKADIVSIGLERIAESFSANSEFVEKIETLLLSNSEIKYGYEPYTFKLVAFPAQQESELYPEFILLETFSSEDCGKVKDLFLQIDQNFFDCVVYRYMLEEFANAL